MGIPVSSKRYGDLIDKMNYKILVSVTLQPVKRHEKSFKGACSTLFVVEVCSVSLSNTHIYINLT